MTIGERLEEARKRKGISIREAAEATKIRGDFLLSMESNAFDISLPEIYVRGFLRNYARYLKVDHEKILTDFEALRLGSAKPLGRRGESRESLGRVEIPDPPLAAVPGVPAAPGPAPSSPGPRSSGSLRSEDAREARQAEVERLYWRLGIIAAVLVVSFVLIFAVVRAVRSGPDIPPAPSGGAAASAQTPVAATLTLVALADVGVVVEHAETRAEVFRGNLTRGDRESLPKSGPLIIKYTRGDALEVEYAGQRFTMGASGVGVTRIP